MPSCFVQALRALDLPSCLFKLYVPSRFARSRLAFVLCSSSTCLHASPDLDLPSCFVQALRAFTLRPISTSPHASSDLDLPSCFVQALRAFTLRPISTCLRALFKLYVPSRFARSRLPLTLRPISTCLHALSDLYVPSHFARSRLAFTLLTIAVTVMPPKRTTSDSTTQPTKRRVSSRLNNGTFNENNNSTDPIKQSKRTRRSTKPRNGTVPLNILHVDNNNSMDSDSECLSTVSNLRLANLPSSLFRRGTDG